MVKRFAFAIPGDLATPTGGYAYDRRIIAELQKQGWQIDVIGLGDGFPQPTAAQKDFAEQQLAAVAPEIPIVIDGLAFGVLPEAAEKLKARRLIGLVHHPLAFESGIAPETAEVLLKSERASLAVTRHVIVNSPSTSQLLADDYDIPPEHVTVAPPGTDRAEPAPGSRDGIVRLVSVGAVVPRKGFDVLIAALAEIKSLPWRLTIAGDRTRDAAEAARLDAEIARHGLGDRVAVLGALPAERIAALYHEADLFVLASRFEGYGMAYAEALAHGLPVIGTTGGAIPDTVPPEAGVLVEPNEVKPLAHALRMLIVNTDERLWLASGARNVAKTLPTWEDSAKLFVQGLEQAAEANA